MLLDEFPNPYKVTINLLFSMSWRIPFTAFAICGGLFFASSTVIAEIKSADDYRVLTKEDIGLSLSTVETYISDGDDLFKRGNFLEARKKFDKARDMSKLLLSFYGDLSNSFKGLDARIPRQMNANSRKVLSLLAKSNLKLASVFRKTDQAGLAVPLLVEVVKISSPSSDEGQKAYQTLVELGFVDIPYRGARKRL